MIGEKVILRKLRAICAKLPESEETLTFETSVTFQVRKKTFTVYENKPEIHGVRIISVKATLDDQAALLRRKGFLRCKFGGRHGWTYVDVDAPFDWDEVTALVRASYCLVAPKKLAATVTG